MRAVNRTDQDWLAYGIAAHGIGPYNDAVVAMVLRARSMGVCSASVEVLADPTQPEVARQRAFGRVAAALARGVRRPRRHAA